MKKLLKKVFSLCLAFCFLFTIGTPAIAAYNSNDLPQILEQEQFFTQDSKPLSSYTCESSTTIDGMKIAAFFDENGNIVASMAEDSQTIVVRFTDGRKYEIVKNSDGSINSAQVTESFVNITYYTQDIDVDSNSDISTNASNASIENYTSRYLTNDRYTHYESLNTWHLYYDNDYAYSGDHASSSILSQCEDFKTHLRNMDAHLDDTADTLMGLIPGYSVAYALATLVTNPSWSSAADLATELILLIPDLAGLGNIITASDIFFSVTSAVIDHSGYVDAFNYVKSNA